MPRITVAALGRDTTGGSSRKGRPGLPPPLAAAASSPPRAPLRGEVVTTPLGTRRWYGQGALTAASPAPAPFTRALVPSSTSRIRPHTPRTPAPPPHRAPLPSGGDLEAPGTPPAGVVAAGDESRAALASLDPLSPGTNHDESRFHRFFLAPRAGIPDDRAAPVTDIVRPVGDAWDAFFSFLMNEEGGSSIAVYREVLVKQRQLHGIPDGAGFGEAKRLILDFRSRQKRSGFWDRVLRLQRFHGFAELGEHEFVVTDRRSPLLETPLETSAAPLPVLAVMLWMRYGAPLGVRPLGLE